MSDNISRRGALKMTALGMLVTLAVAVPTSVWAAHQFNDVATSHLFHREISAVAGAGIAAGFSDGGFHPSAPVSRQAMAAFLERGLGRVASNKNYATLDANQGSNVAGVLLDAGATRSGTGFVFLTGTVQADTLFPANCPCRVLVTILEGADTVSSIVFDVPGQAAESSKASNSATLTAVRPIQKDTTQAYVLRVFVDDVSAQDIKFFGSLTGLYVPLGPDGDNTLAYCSAEEGEPNNSAATATPIGSGKLGCIEPAGDVDVFSVSVPPNNQLAAQTTGVTGAGTCDMDTLLTVRNASGTSVGFNDDHGAGFCSALSTSALEGGTYFVEVRAFGPGVGSYRVTATVAPASGPAVAPPPADANDKD